MPLSTRTAPIAATFAAAILAAGMAGTAQADMVVYDGEGFTLESRVIKGDVADLEDTNFDNRASAIIIRSGTWILFRDDDFEGDSVTLGPGQYPDLGDVGFSDDTLSSIRAVSGGEGEVGGVSTRVEGAASQLAVLNGCDDGTVPVLVLDDEIELVCTDPEEAPRYTVENRAVGRCIDVGNNAAGHRIRLSPCAATPRQQKLGLSSHPGVPGGSFIFFAYTDKCLTAATVGNGAPVGIDSCRGDEGQVWKPVGGPGGTSALVGPGGLCLTASTTGPDAWGGTLGTCTQAAEQLWSIRSTEPFE